MRIIGHALVTDKTPHETGRALLAKLYRELTRDPLPEIRTTSRGKPYFAGSALHFSVTHTGRHVFCALADHPIGIDAEEVDRPIRLALAEKILSPGEHTRWQRASDSRLALLKLWVLKEAYYKFTGDGLRGYPNKTNFSPEDPRIITEHGCLLAIIEGE